MLAAGYLYLSHEIAGHKPNSAVILDKALQLAATGAAGRGLALLDEALRLDPVTGKRGSNAARYISANRTAQSPRSRI